MPPVKTVVSSDPAVVASTEATDSKDVPMVNVPHKLAQKMLMVKTFLPPIMPTVRNLKDNSEATTEDAAQWKEVPSSAQLVNGEVAVVSVEQEEASTVAEVANALMAGNQPALFNNKSSIPIRK